MQPREYASSAPRRATGLFSMASAIDERGAEEIGLPVYA